MWIWLTIRYIITNLNLKVKLIKVKRHSNDIYNNKADALAKNRIMKDELLINIPIFYQILILYIYNNNSMDSTIKKVIVNTNRARNFSSFLNIFRNKTVKQLTKLKHINWKYIFKYNRLITYTDIKTSFV